MTVDSISKFETCFNWLQIQALKIECEEGLQTQTVFINIDRLISLRYLEIEPKDYDNIVTWDRENIPKSLNKFHLKMKIERNE